MTETALIRSYGVATRLLGPLTPVWVRRRARDGKEDPDRLEERHGHASLPRPEGRLVWLHGASVGECVMLLPVIDKILAHSPDMRVLVTSGTVTSANLLADRLPPQAIHQYVPLDYPKAVQGFLNHWQPDLAIWSESEIWPNLIRQTAKREIPMVLLNARLSRKSLDRWAHRGKKTGRALFGAFDLILAANQETARGLSGIVDRKVEMSGNLKSASAPLPAKPKVLANLSSQIEGRSVWCAASTHPGEDELMIDAHKHILSCDENALMILAVRHPERMPDVRNLLKAAGLSYTVRSSGKRMTAQTQVLLFDTIGEMGLAYRLSSISFVCGSLMEGLAGHNPLEPARLSNAVLTGTHIASFADTYMPMFAFNAARRVLDASEIGPMIVGLLADPVALSELQTTAKTYAEGRDAVLDYVWDQITPLIPQPRPDEPSSKESAR